MGTNSTGTYHPCTISVAKPKIFAVFAFTNVLKSPALFFGNLCMNLCNVGRDEAMKR
jgi:hypothetical protein